MFKQFGSSIGDGIDKVLIVGAIGYGAFVLVKYSSKAVMASSGAVAIPSAAAEKKVPVAAAVEKKE